MIVIRPTISNFDIIKCKIHRVAAILAVLVTTICSRDKSWYLVYTNMALMTLIVS